MGSSSWRNVVVLYRMTTVRWMWLALPFALMGAILAAGGMPDLSKLGWILLAFIGARNAGMYLNRLIDKEIDQQNPRTKNRELPQNQISYGVVIGATAVNFALFCLAAYQLNPLCFYIAPALMAAIILYPYGKRFTWGLHFMLGGIMAFAPLGAWIAIRGKVELPALILAGGVLVWCAAFDVILDIQDARFYKKAGLHSLPTILGDKRSIQVALALHIWGLFCFWMLAWWTELGGIYYGGLILIGLLLAYGYMVALVKGFGSYQRLAYWLNVSMSGVFLLATVADIFFRT